MKKYLIKNIDCASCAAKIEDGLSKMSEVNFVNVNFASSTMTIDTADIEPEVEIAESGSPVNIVSKSEMAENKEIIIKAASAFLLLIIGLFFREELHNSRYWILEYVIFVSAYLISGWGVLSSAFRNIIKGRVFDEQFLMTVATLGAFAIREMPEGVAVMLFYVAGEFFQNISVNRSRKSVKALLEIRPDYANLKTEGQVSRVAPEEVRPGQIIIVRPGEKVPLDGNVVEGSSYLDTSALTGESVPRSAKTGESSISKILELVENAGSKKAQTEKFITTFAKYYTPVVVFGALLLALVPPLVISGASFNDWIYRALVVLVISCPCALVISIPLGYFGGIGGASRRGILVKGSNFLDALANIKTVVFDKTGTLTKGEFKVSEIVPANGYSDDDLIKYAAYAESNSNHPIAKSILDAYKYEINSGSINEVKEISGQGIRARLNFNGAIPGYEEIIIGNDKLLHLENIEHGKCDIEGTVVHVAVNKKYAGYIVISDTLKHEAAETIAELDKLNIKTILLTGDNKSAAGVYAKKLGIKEYYSDLLPENKVEHLEKILRAEKKGKIAFAGDGINDAPVIARADVGIAMGALGSDAAVETADVVLMTDSPMQVVNSIEIARRTRKIIWQNIAFALGVKAFFILLGILGIATMWEAVFGDMGVSIIAILNSMRILKTGTLKRRRATLK